jgi:hypothetical protein
MVLRSLVVTVVGSFEGGASPGPSDPVLLHKDRDE